MEVQLDPVGGIAGDMFIAALLHAFPEHQDGVFKIIDALRLPGLQGCQLEARQNGSLRGLRFLVELTGGINRAEPERTAAAHHDTPGAGGAGQMETSPQAHPHQPLTVELHERADAVPFGHRPAQLLPAHPHTPGNHPHTAWLDIRELIAKASLSTEVKRHAAGIFALLAQAEAKVHGISEEQVTFHEVGATDSIVDIVGAAYLIAALQPRRWIIGSLPLGSGRVWTAHGWLPVPAPATALLLEGFPVHQDGIGGERVTPTGAAIVRYLGCRPAGEQSPQFLWRTGIGLGARSLPGVSNCLRVLAFSDTPLTAGERSSSLDVTPRPLHNEESPDLNRRQLAVVEFEVDDQTPEDLATALDHLRSEPGVFDVVQQMAIGKRGRSAAHIRLLTNPDDVERVARRCFQETATIGLRYHFVQGFTLTRTVESVQVAGRSIRVKVVSRPGIGFSGKPEMEDLAQIEGGYTDRTKSGQLATEQALGQTRLCQEAPEIEHPTLPRTEHSHHDENA